METNFESLEGEKKDAVFFKVHFLKSQEAKSLKIKIIP